MASSGNPVKPTIIDLPKAAPRREPNGGPSVADLERLQGNRATTPRRERQTEYE